MYSNFIYSLGYSDWWWNINICPEHEASPQTHEKVRSLSLKPTQTSSKPVEVLDVGHDEDEDLDTLFNSLTELGASGASRSGAGSSSRTLFKS